MREKGEPFSLMSAESKTHWDDIHNELYLNKWLSMVTRHNVYTRSRIPEVDIPCNYLYGKLKNKSALYQLNVF